MTREFMDTQLGRLVPLRGMPGDSDAYFEALSDIPEDAFSAGVGYALRSRSWFPTPAELRADCDMARVHRPMPEPEPSYADLEDAHTAEIRNPFGGASITVKVVRDWRRDCETCADTGWSMRQCPDTSCGRRFSHGPHGFVERCGCAEWNPTIRRRKDAAGAKYAVEKAAVA
jgi:hypothetical protein